MIFGYHPYSKDQQLGKVPKEREKKKTPHKKPKKKRKKVEVVKGRVIPSKRTRGKISKTEYDRAIELHGNTCYFCGTSHNLEMHHVVPKGYSRFKNGRGVARNLRLLCSSCHRGENGVHGKNGKDKMQHLQQLHEELYGPYFYMDRFDLFKMQLIPNTTKEAYESFMKGEEERARLAQMAKTSDTGGISE